MTIADRLLGAESATVEFTWTPGDVMLYALAVGAGQQDPLEELQLTTDDSDSVSLSVLPTFANIITRSARVDLRSVDPSAVVHAEQAFQLPRTLPAAGSAKVSARVVEVWDKRSGALVVIESRAVDALDGTPIATTRMSLFVRGAGGFGGDRGPASSWTARDGDPSARIRFATRPEQALLYRLTGDRNRLHSDPRFARQAGFDRPILHGMCTYGFVGRLLMSEFCDPVLQTVSGMQARFAKPVLPGDGLEIAAWRDGDEVRFTASRGAELVIDQGRLTLTPRPVGTPVISHRHSRATDTGLPRSR